MPYSTVQDEGSDLTQRNTLNFKGDAVTAADNSVSARTDVTVAAVKLQTSSPGTAQTGHFNIDTGIGRSAVQDKGGQVYNVKAYGAMGNGSADDTTAIDAAVSAAQAAVGGVIYFPRGRYRYLGAGIVNNPVVGAIAPLLIRGDGSRQSEIKVESLTNSEFIKLDHQDIIGNEVNRGSGVVGVYILLPSGKDGIHIKDQEDFLVQDVVTYGGRNALLLNESRGGYVSRCTFRAWTGTGIRITGENFADSQMRDITLIGDVASTGWGLEYVKTGTGTPAGPYLSSVVCNSSGQGGFRFEVTDASIRHMFIIMESCTADGVFSSAGAALFKKTGNNYLSNCFFGAQAANGMGVTYDQCDYTQQIGGVVSGNGAGAADVQFKNSCDRITMDGVLFGGPVQAIKTDATTHTNISISSTGHHAGGTNLSNDWAKLQGGSLLDFSTPRVFITNEALGSGINSLGLQEVSNAKKVFLRARSGGGLDILNDAHSAVIATVDDNGAASLLLQAAASKGLLVKAAASHTGNLEEFQDSAAAVQSRRDAKGSLQTLESSRVAPWIEPEVICSANTPIDSTLSTDIIGATVTFTPKSNCRVQVTAFFDVTATTVVSNDVFVGELRVNGTAEGEVALLGALVAMQGMRATIGQVWNFTLTGGTSYTIKLAAYLATDNGSVYTVTATHTKFSLIGLGRF